MKASAFLLFTFILTSCQPLKTPVVKVSGHTNPINSLQIFSISPSNGSINGGTLVTITGKGFKNSTSASVGGVPCTILNFISSTQLTCLTPANIIGTYSITVTDSDKSHALDNSFSYQQNGSPGSGILSGGSISQSAGLQMTSSIGEPVQGLTLSGATVELRGNLQGVISN